MLIWKWVFCLSLFKRVLVNYTSLCLYQPLMSFTKKTCVTWTHYESSYWENVMKSCCFVTFIDSISLLKSDLNSDRSTLTKSLVAMGIWFIYFHLAWIQKKKLTGTGTFIRWERLPSSVFLFHYRPSAEQSQKKSKVLAKKKKTDLRNKKENKKTKKQPSNNLLQNKSAFNLAS